MLQKAIANSPPIDLGFDPKRTENPFLKQLPVFNWFYPFDQNSTKINDPIPLLQRYSPTKVSRHSLYIHIPFCDTICGFCPFSRGLYSGDDILDRYVNAIVREIQLKQPITPRVRIDSVFIGGGTPSVLSAKMISRLGDAIHQYFDLSSLKEFAVEVEAKSVTAEKLYALKSIGVNRVSFGAQTFNADYREILHLNATIRQLKDTASQINALFDYTNVDMIYGFPCQSIEDTLSDLMEAVSLGTTTVDFYPLNNLAAQVGMHKAFIREGKGPLGARSRLEQRRTIAQSMNLLGYGRINGYGFARKGTDQDSLVMQAPVFLYHDILYGHDEDSVLGYGASGITQIPGFNIYNTASRTEYIEWVLDRSRLPAFAYRIDEPVGKSIVTFPYRGILMKGRASLSDSSVETQRALASLIDCNLVAESDNAFSVTESGWLYYVNLMYTLMPARMQIAISETIHARILSGHLCEEMNLC
jgi:coproporphyrinogen III oxidase-like Fe-S oxidoreductase